MHLIRCFLPVSKDIEGEIQEMVYDTDVVMFDSAQKEHEKIGKIIEMSEKSGGGQY